MSDGYVFNYIEWKKENVGILSDEMVNVLDERYINVGENVIDQNINNLNLVNLNISSGGSIYFNHDNTVQTTAYDQNFIINQVNNLKSTDNKYTGKNEYSNLNVMNSVDNTKTGKLWQESNNTVIENKVITGSVILRTNNGSDQKSLIYDLFGNMSGINDFYANRLRSGEITLNDRFRIYDDNGNCVFQNLNILKEFLWKTKTSSTVDGWTMAFNNNGQLYGVNNIISHNVESKYYKFRDLNNFQLLETVIYQSGSEIIIDNGTLSAVFKIKLKRADGLISIFQINEFGNMTGLNDLTLTGRINISNSVSHQYNNGSYVIDNKNNGSNILIRNYDNGGVMRQLTIDPFINMSGINDLYVQRIFFNNTLFDMAVYNATLTKTRLLFSNTQNESSFQYNNGRIVFRPQSDVGNYNNIAKAGDSLIIGSNSGNNSSINALTMATWNDLSNPGAIRITNTTTEIYKGKIMNDLTFNDNTVQTTAMTEAYITNLIQTVVNDMRVNIAPAVIFSYLGVDLPTGYLWCYGGLVQISQYQNLYNAILNKYQNGKPFISGYFYLPDLQGCFLKGIGDNSNFISNTPIINTGDYQQGNVGSHVHQYKDQGIGTKTLGAGTNNAAQPSSGLFFTEDGVYNSSRVLLDAENRPNSMGVNYIIKF
jgi:microcystin-dependent protein